MKKLNCVLLIDDDEPTNFLNQLVVESSGCAERIRIAQSGEEALNYLMNCGITEKDPRPDLIFLDINMPAMNGWEFLEKYKALDEAKKGKVVIVMLTTSLFSEDRIRAYGIHEISGFENKPLNREKLDRIITDFFKNERKAV